MLEPPGSRTMGNYETICPHLIDPGLKRLELVGVCL